MSGPIKEPVDAPVVRIRLNHTYTVKDGWRMADSTVEMTVAIPTHAAGAAVFPDLAELLHNAYETGKYEADERNRLEKRIKHE